MHAGTDGLASKLAVVHNLLQKRDRTMLQSASRKLRLAKREFEKVTASPLSDVNVARQKELA